MSQEDSDSYWVLEFRYPVQIDRAASVEEAARLAREIAEKETGAIFSNWFIRAFKFDDSGEDVGPSEEWFSNPHGTKWMRIDENIEKSDELKSE